MDTYTTSQTDAPDSTERAADPPPRPQRFDERGIALQTIIIMVVLLAIAASVAGVLLNRAGQETNRLQSQDAVASSAYAITNVTLCRTAGHTWATTGRTNGASGTPQNADLDDAGLNAALRIATMAAAISANDGYCHPTP